MNMTVAAPGKLNVCLHLGPIRDDGFHALVSLFDSVSLHDTLTLEARGEDATDVVVCPGVAGENIVARALRGCRESGLLTGPALRLRVDKRVPVAAGMGGGSGDAAAALRLVSVLERRPLSEFQSLAFALGADVPSQLHPGTAVVTGAGELVAPVDGRCLAGAGRAYVVVAQSQGLSTADVFRQADLAELPDPAIAAREEELTEALAGGLDLDGFCALVHNDFEQAIVALRPELVEVPRAILAAGALAAAFTGSGPTCFGVFPDLAAAELAAAALREDGHLAHAAEPVDEAFARPVNGHDGADGAAGR